MRMVGGAVRVQRAARAIGKSLVMLVELEICIVACHYYFVTLWILMLPICYW